MHGISPRKYIAIYFRSVPHNNVYQNYDKENEVTSVFHQIFCPHRRRCHAILNLGSRPTPAILIIVAYAF